MFAEKHYPEILRPEELDDYLSRGWYRMGQTIFTTHFLCFDEQFYSAIWVRLPLKGYRFRKSLRKIVRRNSDRFKTVFRKAYLDREKEYLYQKYKAGFPGLLAPSLRDSLLDGEEFNIFDTYEVAVYDDGQLIATSFFDLGRNSVASIMGIYDPRYSKYSLGFYTMLMEIAYAQEHNFVFYYPGYVVPGYVRFDYKLRIGEVSYYDLATQNWRPYRQIAETDIPVNRMKGQLNKLGQLLKNYNVLTRQLYYPLFEVNLFGFWRTDFFDHPVFLHCNPDSAGPLHLLVVYDVRSKSYLLLRCSPFDDIQFYFNEAYTNSFNRDHFFMELLVIEQIIAREPTAEAMAAYIGRMTQSNPGELQNR